MPTDSRNYTGYNTNTKVLLIGKELAVNNVAFNTINFDGSSDIIDSTGTRVHNTMRGSFFIDPGGLSYSTTDTLFLFPTLAEEDSGTQQNNACLRLKLVISDFSGDTTEEENAITKSVIYNIIASSPINNTGEPYYDFDYILPTQDTNDQYNTVSGTDPPLLEFVSSPNFIGWDNTNKRFLMRILLTASTSKHLIRGMYTIM
jgi:hypothetical protein